MTLPTGAEPTVCKDLKKEEQAQGENSVRFPEAVGSLRSYHEVQQAH